MELKPGYKQTEAGVIPEDWECKRLESLGRRGRPAIKAGPFGSSLTKATYVAEGYKVYGQEQVIRGDYLYGDYFISKYRYEELKSCAVQPGDVLLSLVGTSGRVLVIPPEAPEGIINPRLMRFSFDPNVISSDFFKLVFESEIYQSLLARSAQGGTMGVLNAGLLKPIEIPLPPLPEQRAIAAALSDMDALLAAQDQLLAKKRDIKQAVMQQLLTGKQRLPGFSGEWEVKRLGDICQIGMGRTPSRRIQSFWGRGYPWLSIADLKAKYVSETKEEITPLAAAGMTVIPKGTLIMSFKLSIGRMAFTGRDMYSNEAICSFGELKMNADYLYYVLGQTDFSLHGKQAVKGFTLNSESLKLIEVPYPPLPEQTAIAAVLSDMDSEIDALQQRRDKTQMLKQGMMQELLTGRTRLV